MQPSRVTTVQELDELTAWLRSDDRDQPVVLISTPNGTAHTRFNDTDVATTLRDEAEVFIIETGDLTWRLTDNLGEGFSVYGGAARVYPVGTGWLEDMFLSPLVFAYEADVKSTVTGTLIRVARKFSPALLSFTTVTAPDPASSASLFVETLRSVRDAGVVPGPVGAAPAVRRDEPAETVAVPSEPSTPAPTQSSKSALQCSLESVATERARVSQLEAALATADDAAEQRLAAATAELRRELATAESNLRVSREAQRIAGSAARAARAKRQDGTDSIALPLEQFIDQDDAARHAIYLAWVERIPASDKVAMPLPSYALSDRFTASLTDLTSDKLAKALRCAVDVLTGLADTSVSRRVHPLRQNEAGDSGVTTDTDGAVCMRANIESNTASARRLHYWKRPNGSIELIRVVLHDVMEP